MVVSWRILAVLSISLLSVVPSHGFLPLFGNPFFRPFLGPDNADVHADFMFQTKNKNAETLAFGDHDQASSSGAMMKNDKDKKAVKTELRGGEGQGGEAQAKWPGKWELFIKSSGVSAMHAILMPKINKVLIYDATIWRISQIKLPPGVPCHVVDPKKNQVDCWAHSVQIDIETGGLRALKLGTDTWCSSGGLSINGTLVGTGGFQGGANTARYLGDCDTCDWIEYPTALATGRWYSTQVTLPDGTFIVVGGRDAMNYEFIPEEGKTNTKLYDSLLLRQTTDKDENNLYPFVYLNTDGNLFVFANNRSILLSPVTNKVIKEYPALPGGSRNYPGSGISALLPIRLHPVNGKVIPADVLVCGGSPHDAFSRAGKKEFLDALQDCARMTITSPKPVWKQEMMPMPRVMSDTLILPTGDVLFVNGAKKGCAGWGFAKEPNFAPVLYMPRRHMGQRFKELAPTTIPRVYHSTAVVLPDGKVLVAGSNTNNGYVYNAEFPTELRVEKFSPPYLDPSLAATRPAITAAATPKQVKYNQNFAVRIQLNQPNVSRKELKVTLLVPPFTTHSISMNQRMLILGLTEVVNGVGGDDGAHDVMAVAPPSGKVAPPGYYMMFAVYKGVPSVGEWIQVVS